MIYCSQNYTHSDYCLCSGCDGNCGPENGCPCPLCEAILGYNIYSKSINMNCPRCKNLFVKTTVGLLKKIVAVKIIAAIVSLVGVAIGGSSIAFIVAPTETTSK